MDLEEFHANWDQLSGTETFTHSLESLAENCRTADSLQARLVHNNVFYAGRELRPDGEVQLFSSKSLKSYTFLMELRLSTPRASLLVRASVPPLAQHFVQAVSFLLSTTF